MSITTDQTSPVEPGPTIVLTELERVQAMDDEEVRTAALAWANDLRAEYNLSSLDKLPQGQPQDPAGCVLAMACNGVGDYSVPLPCDGRRYVPGIEGRGQARFAYEGAIQVRPTPVVVGEFIRRFDRGRYPDLVRPSSFSLWG